MLEVFDYIILLAVLLFSLGIGLYHSRTGGHQRTTQEFILNNRKLKLIPTLLSFLVSFQSAISIMHSPSEYYKWGAQAWFVAEMSQFFTFILAERLIVPVFYKLQLTSTFDYFEIRFQSKVIRSLASILGVLNSIGYMAVTVLGASVALETMTDVPFQAGIGVMVGCCAVYTSLGGMRAVIWTDVIQSVVMIVGLVICLLTTVHQVGGLDKVFDTGIATGRMFYARFDLNPCERLTFWNLMIYCIPFFTVNFGVSQASMQRYTALPSLGKARLLMLLLAPSFIIYMSLCYFVGAAVLSFFDHVKCDPFESGILSSPNQLMPFFVKVLFAERSGGQGLFLAMVYSASLSSISTMLSGAAANIWEDLIRPIVPGLTERKAAVGLRILVGIVAVLMGGLSVSAAYMPGNLNQIMSTLTGAVSGPLYGMFYLGLLTKQAEWRGTLVGCLSGFSVTAWISLGSLYHPNPSRPLPPLSTQGCGLLLNNRTDLRYDILPTPNSTLIEDHISHATGIQQLYTISFMWFATIGLWTTIIVGLLSSKIICKLFKITPPVVRNDCGICFKNLWNFEGLDALCKHDDLSVEHAQGDEEVGTSDVLVHPQNYGDTNTQTIKGHNSTRLITNQDVHF